LLFSFEKFEELIFQENILWISKLLNLNKIKTISVEVMPDINLKTDPQLVNENLPKTSNDPEVVFNLFINRLIGPNKKTSYGREFYLFP
jgi:hypothetical protein